MKYAVLALSGTQYQVEEGKTYTVDLLDAKEGDTLTSDQVLLLVNDQDVKVGTPTLKTTVEYQVVKHYQGDKVDVYKYKAKSRYRKHLGFRPQLTDIKILKINF